MNLNLIPSGGGVLRISSDGDDRMDAKIKNPQKIPAPEINPLKIPEKNAGYLIPKLRGRDKLALPRIFRLFWITKKIPT